MNTNLRDFKGEKFGCSMVHSSFGWFHVPECVAVYVGTQCQCRRNEEERIAQNLFQRCSIFKPNTTTGFELKAKKKKVFTDLAKDDDDVASKESVGNFWTNQVSSLSICSNT